MIKTFFLAASGVLAAASGAVAAPKIAVENISKNVPAMAMLDHSAIMHFRLVNNSGKPYTIKDLGFSLEGSNNIQWITSAALFYGDRKPAYGDMAPDSLVQIAGVYDDGRFSFKPNTKITADTLNCWVALRLKNNAGTSTNRVCLSCTDLVTSAGKLDVSGLKAGPLRVGVAVRRHNQDHVNTSRIPGLATTTKGTLIALYDARRDRDDDLQGDIDICINRSTNGGVSWGDIIRAIDMGEYGGLPQKYNGVSDGSVLVDPSNGRIWVAGLWMHGINDPKTGKWVEGLNENSNEWNHQWRAHGSNPGYDIKGTSQFMLAYSDDDGMTWSKPVNITKQVKTPEQWLMAPAPGRGIVMEDGTLVFPAEGRDAKGMAFSTIIYSKDHGKTWTAGEPATFNTNECQVVELSDHSLMLNARHRANRRLKEGNGRAVAVTKDMGKTWTEHPTSRKALIEPTCQGGLYRHDYVEDGVKKHVLLFTNPSDTDSRINHTLKVSFDDGMTWPEEYWMLLDEGKGAGYSCITAIDQDTIGIFYEGSQSDIQFQAIPFDEIIRKKKQ